MSVMHNLMMNPVPVSIAGWKAFGGARAQMANNQRSICVQNLVGGQGKGIEYKLLSLPVGEYVYGFRVECATPANKEQLSLIKSASEEKYLCAVYRTRQSGFYTASFTLPEPGCKLLFVAPLGQNESITVSDFIMTPASEWPVVQDLYDIGGISDPYFYGESLPYA